MVRLLLSTWRLNITLFLIVLISNVGYASAFNFSVALTGDVNFNPNVTNHSSEYPWGALLPTLQNFDLLLINHESTAANLNDPSPNDYKYEDPMNLTSSLLQAAGVSFTGQSNNHQFDFWDIGVNRTMNVLSQLPTNIQTGGLYERGNIDVDQKEPILFPIIVNGGLTSSSPSSSSSTNNIAIFSLVAQLCHKDPTTGQDIMDSCTCGIPDNTSSTFSDMPPAQCYSSNNTEPGLWYLSYPLLEDDIEDVVSVIETYHMTNTNDIIIINIHAGPNFEWEPASDRESLLRRLSDAGADIVWGTSSHHLQRMENRFITSNPSSPSMMANSGKAGSGFGRPIIYGLGDLLFRFIPGVDKPETCEEGMAPCQRFRPAISVVYEFIFEVASSDDDDDDDDGRSDNKVNLHDHTKFEKTTKLHQHLSKPVKQHGDDDTASSTSILEAGGSNRPFLIGIRAHPTIHDSMQTQPALGEDKRWFKRKFNELSVPYGFKMQEDSDTEELWVVPCNISLSETI